MISAVGSRRRRLPCGGSAHSHSFRETVQGCEPIRSDQLQNTRDRTVVQVSATVSSWIPGERLWYDGLVGPGVAETWSTWSHADHDYGDKLVFFLKVLLQKYRIW